MFADEDALEAANILPVDPQRVDVYPLTPGLVSGGSGRLALKMAEDRTVTLIDTQTSRSIPVEGYTLPDMLLGDIWFYDNPAGTWLLAAARDPEQSYNYTHIAVLGLEGGVSLERRSADGVKAAVDELVGQGAVSLVFDMRNNGGGYLDELTEMLDYLLPEGPIFRSRDRAGNEQVTNSDAHCIDLPMATLVNKSTYSAAEFFGAELQEWGVGVIVGEETTGKGYSQQTYPLPGGGGLGISTGAYFTGQGTSLIGTGVTLDQECVLTDEENALLKAGKLPRGDDAPLQAAIKLLEEKKRPE